MDTADHKSTNGLIAEDNTVKYIVDDSLEGNSILRNTIQSLGISEDDPQYKEIEKRLIRKLDIRCIPWLSILYLMLSLDRNNIGNARLGTLEKDLNLVGDDYYNALTIFFAGYIIMHIPSNIMVKKVKAHRWISFTMVMWGICSLCQAFTYNASGLIAARFFLGFFETGVGPSTPYFLSFWYQSDELASRVAIYFGSSTVAGAFSGAIAYAVFETLEGRYGIAGWRWLFMVEAIPTICLGILTYFVLPSTPQDIKVGWLTLQEKEIAVQRTIRSGNTDKKEFDKKQFIAGIRDYKTLLTVLIFIGLNVGLASFAVFLPTLVKDMGFSSLEAQLLTVPPYFASLFVVFLVSWNSDRVRQRGYHILAVSLVGALGYIFLMASPSVSLRYTGAVLVACGTYPIVPLTLAWAANIHLGHTKRGVAIACTSMFGQVFSIVGTQVYRSYDAPRYIRGNAIAFVFILISGVSAFVLRVLLDKENKRRDREYGIPESTDMTGVDIDGVYDNYPQFRYTL